MQDEKNRLVWRRSAVGRNWYQGYKWTWSNTDNEIYDGKNLKLRQNTSARGVIEYRVVYGTRVIYDNTILSLGLNSINLEYLENMTTVYPDENNVVMNKKAGSKIPLKPKSPFKWGFMDIIPSKAPKRLTSDTTCSNCILIVNAYSTEEVMEKLDVF